MKAIQFDIEQAIQEAISCHQSGRLAEAETLYREVLRQRPNSLPALHMLGVLAAQAGRHETAVTLLGRAAVVHPSSAALRSDLSTALSKAGRIDEAIDAAREAVRLEPRYPEALNNLGVLLCETERWTEAEGACREATLLKPDYADAHSNLGNALQGAGKLDAALEAYRRSLELRPGDPKTLSHLGCALTKKGCAAEAIELFRRALQLDPHNARTQTNLGLALADCWRLKEAIAAHEEAIRIDPEFADAYNHLGVALLDERQIDAAAAAFERALELNQNFPAALANLGNGHKIRGQIDLAIDAYRRAVTLDPTNAASHSNLVLALCYQPDGAIASAEAFEWNRRHGRPLKKFIRPHGNDRSPERRLRIGYVSADFRPHVLGNNLLPLMRAHDHEQVDIICYSAVVHEDARTEEFRKLADGWRRIVGVNDSAAAELIRSDEIDILVDLALHTAGNRLPLFARKPAPVQATYLGYNGTTGLEAIDYRISDPHLDPPDANSERYSERVIRLPRCTWCYEPEGPTPPVSPLPAASAGFVTFASRNSLVKLSDAALELWLDILESVPRSRLLLSVLPGQSRDRIRGHLARRSISAERLIFAENQPWEEFVRSYEAIDLALDPFPYCGWITTCDALWLGAPVVTLSGTTAVGRGGRSIMFNLGLPELVAETPRQYFEIAVSLAKDVTRLGGLRFGLRERMERSPLRDPARLARDIEGAYRVMWREWCHEYS